jgi:transmembrane sensor
MTRSDLARAGELIRSHVQPPPSETSPAVVRVSLLDTLARTERRGKRVKLAMAVMTAAAAAVLLFFFVPRPGASVPVSFTVGREGAPGQVGAYVTPSAKQALELRFSEGSVVSLDPETRARVTEVSARGAVVLVEAGRAAVDVVHRPDADWRVLAGPYSIAVTGTSFDVAFDPQSQALDLQMHTGVVMVSGPDLAAPVEVRGSQRFAHRGAPAVASARPAEDIAPVASAGPAGAPPVAAPVGASLPSASAAALDPGQHWAILAGRGEYRIVLEAAESQGLDRVLASAGSADLVALANAARFSGRTEVATRAYQAVRDRFSGTPEAASAAFLLGRMTESSSPSGAIVWYDRYVAEAPGGSFIAEALGRRMIALKRTGNTDATRQAAEAYLQRFPGGPYAGVAREMTTP